MIAPFIIAGVAVPVLVALWLVAWLFGDLFAGPERSAVRVRSGRRPR